MPFNWQIDWINCRTWSKWNGQQHRMKSFKRLSYFAICGCGHTVRLLVFYHINILLEIRHIYSACTGLDHTFYTQMRANNKYCTFLRIKTSMRHVERNELILNESKINFILRMEESSFSRDVFCIIETIPVRRCTICGQFFVDSLYRWDVECYCKFKSTAAESFPFKRCANDINSLSRCKLQYRLQKGLISAKFWNSQTEQFFVRWIQNHAIHAFRRKNLIIFLCWLSLLYVYKHLQQCDTVETHVN